MNATKAKAIRKEIYGTMSLKSDRYYLRSPDDQIINHPASLRARYQRAKRTGRGGA